MHGTTRLVYIECRVMSAYIAFDAPEAEGEIVNAT
jgi:hypothetical protein